MKKLFENGIDRKGTDSIKWDYLDKYFGEKDLLALWVADMDFEAPKEVMEAIKNRSEHGAYGYTAYPESLYKSIVSWEKRRHDWEVDPEWILYTPGIVPAINFAIDIFSKPNDGVVIQTPVYPPFIDACRLNNRKMLNNKLLLKDGRYEIDFENLEYLFKNENPKLMIIANPHNPVGRVFTYEELKKIGELCVKYDVLLISDEIHQDIIYKGHEHTCIASISDEVAFNTITCIAPSKTFNVAGCQLSAIIIKDREKRKKFWKYLVAKGLNHSNVFGITAAEASYNYGENWLDNLLIYLEENFNYIDTFIKENMPQIKMIKPEGTYLAWLDFNGLGLDDEQLNELLVKKAGVALNDGSQFGEGGEGFRRINFACPRKTITKALIKIKDVISQM